MELSRRQELGEFIESYIVKPTALLCTANSDLLETCFIPGSYAFGDYNERLPSINMYFIAAPRKAAHARLLLSDHYSVLRKRCRSAGYDIALDCHPYTVAVRPAFSSSYRCIEITSKVMDAGLQRLSLPPTIGGLWVEKYILVYGSDAAVRSLRTRIETNAEWFQAIHEALSRYKNILDHLPWALLWHDEPKLLVEESLRYGKEAMRDGLTIILSQSDLDMGRQSELYYSWKTDGSRFMSEHYGEDGAWMNTTVERWKQRLSSEAAWSRSDAVGCYLDAIKIWEVVWNKFCERVKNERPSEAAWMTRVNAFV